MSDFAHARRMMVDTQVRPADVTSLRIIDAMLAVPRERFVPKARRAVAYVGDHLQISATRWELEPRLFAKMLEAARIDARDLVLVVGSGMGYAPAVIARLAGAVVAHEEDSSLSAGAAEANAACGALNVIASTGPLAEGDAANGPYDVIFINGGVGRVPPALLAQLKLGGRLVAVVMEGVHGRLKVYHRVGEGFAEQVVCDAAAPLLPGFARPAEFVF